MTDLTACPFCGGHAHWCMCDEEGCHRIECDGCRFQLDLLEELNDFDTVEQIREVMARRWNTRADQGGEEVAVADAKCPMCSAPVVVFPDYSDGRGTSYEYAHPPRATAVEDARDAARYRWIKDHVDIIDCKEPHGMYSGWLWERESLGDGFMIDLDERIDTALSAQRGE